MLAHIHRLPRLNWQRHHFARSIPRKSDMSRPLRLRHDERETGKHPFPRTGQRHGGDVDLRVLPQQNMMRKIDAVGSGEIHVRHRYVDAFDLAKRVAELELGHVLAAGKFCPARFGGDRLGIESRATTRTTILSGIDNCAAPLTRGQWPTWWLVDGGWWLVSSDSWRRHRIASFDACPACAAKRRRVLNLTPTTSTKHQPSSQPTKSPITNHQSLRMMVHVHRLNAHAARPRHSRQTHIRPAEESCLQPLE